jgi:hypothetical protein
MMIVLIEKEGGSPLCWPELWVFVLGRCYESYMIDSAAFSLRVLFSFQHGRIVQAIVMGNLWMRIEA